MKLSLLHFFKKRQRAELRYDLARAVFRVALVTLILLLVVDFFEPGFVSNWFNPLWVLLLVVVSGILSYGSDS